MAYISTEKVAKMRANLKKEFPAKDGWKFSVRKMHHSEIAVAIVRGPITFKQYTDDLPVYHRDGTKRRAFEEMSKGSVNIYHIDQQHPSSTAKVLNRILEIISEDHYDESDAQTDYFNCAYYRDIRIGKDYATPYEKV